MSINTNINLREFGTLNWNLYSNNLAEYKKQIARWFFENYAANNIDIYNPNYVDYFITASDAYNTSLQLPRKTATLERNFKKHVKIFCEYFTAEQS